MRRHGWAGVRPSIPQTRRTVQCSVRPEAKVNDSTMKPSQSGQNTRWSARTGEDDYHQNQCLSLCNKMIA